MSPFSSNRASTNRTIHGVVQFVRQLGAARPGTPLVRRSTLPCLPPIHRRECEACCSLAGGQAIGVPHGRAAARSASLRPDRMCESTQPVHFNAGVNHPAPCCCSRTCLSRGYCGRSGWTLDLPGRLQTAQCRAQCSHLHTGSRRGREKRADDARHVPCEDCDRRGFPRTVAPLPCGNARRGRPTVMPNRRRGVSSSDPARVGISEQQ